MSVFSQLSSDDPETRNKGWGRLLKAAEDPEGSAFAWENLAQVMLRRFDIVEGEHVGRLAEVAFQRIKAARPFPNKERRRRRALEGFCAGIRGKCSHFLYETDAMTHDRDRQIEVLIMYFDILDACFECSNDVMLEEIEKARAAFGKGPGRHLPNPIEDMVRRRLSAQAQPRAAE